MVSETMRNMIRMQSKYAADKVEQVLNTASSSGLIDKRRKAIEALKALEHLLQSV